MPAARTSNARHSRQPLQTHPVPKVEHEVIVVSDSDSPPPRKVRKTSRDSRVRPRTKARHVAPSSGDIIELNDSGDEVFAPRQKKSSSASSQEAKNKALEEENRHLKEEIKRLSAAAAFQRPTKGALPNMERERDVAVRSKQTLLSTLEDHVTCEICTFKMWSPYILSCGHTFCLDCLQDWFNTALAQYMTTHPDWPPQHPALQQCRQLLQQGHLTAQMQQTVRRQMEQILANIPRPNYTCPSCREPVRTAPIEAFVLKHVVRTVAEAQGESSPGKRGAGGVKRDDLWSGFFCTIDV